MSDLSPIELEKLILGYEELGVADKAVADRILKRQSELAAKLKWHQDKENQARNAASCTGEFWNDEYLDAADEQAQQESLRKILAAIEWHQETRPSGLAGRLRSGIKWMLPLAALLALAILLPRGGTPEMLLQDLTVTRIELNTDGSRGINHPAPIDGVLHSGQAFALDFTLVDQAYVVVYHVGPAGRVSRVFPVSITGAVSRHDGGREHQIPDPDSGEVWILGTETGTESFLLAVGSAWPTGLESIRVDSGSADRGKILASLRNQLEDIMPQVDLYEFDHVD